MKINRCLGNAILSAAILTSLWTSSASAAKTLVFCSEGSPEGFNPQLYTSSITFDASSRQVYNRLVEFDRRSIDIMPGLAERWVISPDGLQYTFYLRKGVKFHTIEGFKLGRDFNADDVLFSFDRQRDPNHPYHKVSGGSYEYFNSMGMPELIKSIDKLDDYTVRFTLNRPEAPFLAYLAMDYASILSAEYADKLLKAGKPEQLDLVPVGTGPFQRVAYQKDAVIRYRANPDYWKGKAPIDNLIFAITPDASVRYAKLKAGECHVMPFPHPADLEAMREDKSIKLLEREGMNVGYLAFNTQKKPFDDKRVRQALNLAIDKHAIIEAVFQGAGIIAKNPFPPAIWSYNDAVKDYPYDPDKGLLLPTFFGVTLIAFSLVHLIPGDPIQILLGERGIDPARHAQLMAELGLDKPLWQQYLLYIGQVVPGNLGASLMTREPVLHEFLTLFPATVELSVAAILFAILIGLPLGVIARMTRSAMLEVIREDYIRVARAKGLPPTCWATACAPPWTPG